MIKAEKVIGRDGNQWIKASFRKNPVVFDTMRTVKGAMYDFKSNMWAVPYIHRDDFEDKLGQFLIDWLDEPTPFNGGIPEEDFSKYPTVPGYSVTYEGDKIVSSTGFKLNPWADFQVRGFNAIVERDFLILGDDMGLGN